MTTTKQISIDLTEEEKEILLKARKVVGTLMEQIDRNMTWHFRLTSQKPAYESRPYERSQLYVTTYMLQYLGNCDAVTFNTEEDTK